MKSKRKKPLVFLMIIMLLSQLILIYGLAELVREGSFIIGPGEAMHRVTFKDADGTLLDEMYVKDGTDMRKPADQLANSQGASLTWQSDSQSTLGNIISDTTFTAKNEGIALFGVEEPLLNVADPRPGLEIYDSEGNPIQNNSTIGLTELLLMKLRFDVFNTSNISPGVTYVYPLPVELTPRPGAKVVLMNNGVIFGEAWIEDSTFKVVFTQEAVDYEDGNFIFGYECTQAFNLGCLDDDGKIPESIIIYLDGEETTIYIQAEDGSPKIESKNVNYKTDDPRYPDDPFVLNWTLTVDPYTVNGVGIPMPATIEDTFGLDKTSPESQAATEQEYIEGSMVVKVGDRTLDASEYKLVMREDNSGFTLDLPEFSEPVTVTYTTKPANGWKGLLDASGSLQYSNTAQLTENGEPVGDEKNASHHYYPNYLDKAFSGIEQTEDSYRVTWEIEVLKLYYSYPFLLSGTYVKDLLANGVEFVGLYKSNGDPVPDSDPGGEERNIVYYELVDDNLTIHFPNGADANTTLKLVMDYPLDWSEAISNTATLVIPDEGEKSTTVEVGSDDSKILKQSQGFDRKTNSFRWTVTIFAGDGLEEAYFRDYPDYWKNSYYGASSAYGTSQFSRIIKITGYDILGNALDIGEILNTQNEYAAPNGGTYTEFLLGDIKGVVVIELETKIADDKEFSRTFYNTAKVIDKNNNESSSSVSYYLYDTDYTKTYLPRDEALKQFPDLADDEVAWMIYARFDGMSEITINDELGPNLTFSTNEDHYKSSVANGWSNFINSAYISYVSGGPKETALTFTVKKSGNATSFSLYFVTRVDSDAFTDVSCTVHVSNKVTYFGDGLPDDGIDRNASGTLSYTAMKKTAEIWPGLARWIITINPSRKVDFFPESYEKATVTDVLHPNLRLDHGKFDVSLTNEEGDSIDFDFSYDPGVEGNTVQIVFDAQEVNGHTLTLTIDTTILADFTTSNEVVLSADGFKILDVESPGYPLDKDANAYIETNIYLNIEKVDEFDNRIKLEGVLFELYLPGESTPVAVGTTNEEGIVSFRDLDYKAQYILVEYGIDGYHWIEGTIGGHEHAMLVFPGPASFVTIITNRPIVERIVVSGTKTWDDDDNQDGTRPASITVNLLADGKNVGTKAVGEADGWSYEWTDLPKYENGIEIEYSVTEDAIDGYGMTVTGYDIHNSYTAEPVIPETVTVSGTKTWEDNGDLDGTRPASITVNLLADGKNVGTKTVSEADGWSYEWTDLPKYEGGLEIQYSVTEDPVEGYSVTVTGYGIHNSYTQVSVDVTIRKRDAQTRDTLAGAKFTLTGGSPPITQSVTTDSDGLATFSGLMPGTYTLRETQAPDGYAKLNSTWMIIVTSNGTVMNEGVNITSLIPIITNQILSPGGSNSGSGSNSSGSGSNSSGETILPKTGDDRNGWVYWLLLPLSGGLIGGYYRLKRKRGD